jgi:6-phosphogluconolactonase/glucosamine-6-phosphate isomerase/deaminase
MQMLPEKKQNELQLAKSDFFWREIAPCEHVVQIYEDDDIFLDSLTGFVGGGINAGDAVIVIATGTHLRALYNRLQSYALNVDSLIADGRYIPLNAKETLAKFMVNGWPDETLFMETVSKLIGKAGRKNRRIRAFGEMVAILWAQGNDGATLQLEDLWNKFSRQSRFSLFCAYPKSGFTKDNAISITDICSCHSRVLDGSKRSITEILYHNTMRA